VKHYDLKELENKFLKSTGVLNCMEFQSLFLNRFGIKFRK
jgi:hypothetical protein